MKSYLKLLALAYVGGVIFTLGFMVLSLAWDANARTLNGWDPVVTGAMFLPLTWGILYLIGGAFFVWKFWGGREKKHRLE